MDDRVNLLGQNQPGQVEHGTDPNTRAEVGRAGRQIPELRAESIVQLLFECRIGGINRRPGQAQLEPGAQGLHAQVVFLIDQEAERFISVQHQPAPGALRRMLAANEVAFYQDLLVQ